MQRNGCVCIERVCCFCLNCSAEDHLLIFGVLVLACTPYVRYKHLLLLDLAAATAVWYLLLSICSLYTSHVYWSRTLSAASIPEGRARFGTVAAGLEV